jgi:hypothetical protein
LPARNGLFFILAHLIKKINPLKGVEIVFLSRRLPLFSLFRQKFCRRGKSRGGVLAKSPPKRRAFN